MFEDGSIQVKGRAKDTIRFKVLGDVIYRAPIEEALGQHPAIRACSVCRQI